MESDTRTFNSEDSSNSPALEGIDFRGTTERLQNRIVWIDIYTQVRGVKGIGNKLNCANQQMYPPFCVHQGNLKVAWQVPQLVNCANTHSSNREQADPFTAHDCAKAEAGKQQPGPPGLGKWLVFVLIAEAAPEEDSESGEEDKSRVEKDVPRLGDHAVFKGDEHGGEEGVGDAAVEGSEGEFEFAAGLRTAVRRDQDELLDVLEFFMWSQRLGGEGPKLEWARANIGKVVGLLHANVQLEQQGAMENNNISIHLRIKEQNILVQRFLDVQDLVGFKGHGLSRLQPIRLYFPAWLSILTVPSNQTKLW
ncbi:hypothetical protein CPB84DRAFT_1881247 [Gymnopilus junonius]|uniref:Uncharacterized protein n=1 Tax=Gymnopilus junonius TaxID=109634 RepID=A0A9P5NBP2_GYMJU|nr:hypothetical protein CPB84DRAFT_1881247 [Gymnopilus junonius]